MGMRVLVTGLGTYWGSRLAQELESRDDVDVVVGVDVDEPVLPLERTEFVRTDQQYSILQRIVQTAAIDTVLHTHLIVDSTEMSGRGLHEINVIGTMNLLAAAGAAGSPVRKFVMKSSTLHYGSNYQDPYYFSEEMERTRSPRTRVERSLLEVSGFVDDFAQDNPHILVTKLRFSNVLGGNIDTPIARALRLPLVPEIFGFDTRIQFIHEEDVVGALLFTTAYDVPGVYNVAGDGTITWSEVCKLVAKRRIALPPIFTNWAAEPLRLLRIVELPPEVIALLRYGRGVDNRAFKEAGYRYRYTTAGAVDAYAQGLRLQRAIGGKAPTYRYERDVENFFRHSPAVVQPIEVTDA
jgi:UDP-glucose 4-epimerase